MAGGYSNPTNAVADVEVYSPAGGCQARVLGFFY
jgi:hypothetical protein